MHRARAPLAGFLTTVLAIGALGSAAAPPAAAATTVVNPGFETGDLSGWTATGTAFQDSSVSAAETYWDKRMFEQHNLWHVYGGPDDQKVGVLESETFTLAGSGTIDLLVGGSDDLANAWVGLVDDATGAVLGKVTGPGNDTYVRRSIEAPSAVGNVVRIRVVDSTTTGHVNVDDVDVPPSPSLNGHVEPALYNHDFEQADLVPGEIRGWDVVSGTAFSPSSLTHEEVASPGGPFRHRGGRHLWGFAAAGDAATGSLRSSTFTLSGNGGIDFLIGGGRDMDRLYVALRRASDGAELFRATGTDSERYRRQFWDASAYLGQDLYLDVVDESTGGFGHINLDDVRVVDSPFADRLAHWSLDEGTGTSATESVTGSGDRVEYHLNEGVNQPARPPLWRSDGVRGGALLFDGYSTWLGRAPDKTPAPTKALTVSAWVAPRTFEHGDEGRLSTIVGQHDRAAKEGYVLGHFRHGDWGLRFGTGSEWRAVMSDAALPLDEWSHVTATYDSTTGQARLYLDGSQVGAADFPPGEEIRPSGQDLLVGRNNQGMWLYGFSMNMFAGLVDEVSVSPTVQVASAVETAYEADVAAVGGNLPTPDNRIGRDVLADDRQKPQFHGSAPVHWQNEPSGPVYFNGQYHVFYQSNPRGPYWNHIRWGHLVSTDMVHWRDADDAIVPGGGADADPDGAWAGGSVLDGDGRPVLFYTAGDDRESPNQRIALARTPQNGDNDLNTWVKSKDIVVDQGPGEGIPGEFRDPFVFRDGDTWFMLVTSGTRDAAGDDVGGTALVYSTADPTLGSGWTFRGDLFVGDYAAYPETGRVWELPNLLPLGDSGKWAFIINPAKMARGEYQSRSTYYWIGSWDPATAKFVPDTPEPRLVDVGEHFTGPAGSVTPDGRSVLFSLAQGRRTATMDYQAGNAHGLGAPVELTLASGNRLGVAPISELSALRGEPLVSITTNASFAAANHALASVQGDMLDIEVEIDPGSANEVGLEVLRSPGAEEETRVYYKRSAHELTVDRTRSSLNPDVEKWYQRGEADAGTGNLRFRTLVDRSLVETYLNGVGALTTRAYPTRTDATGLRLWASSDESTVTVKSLKVWPMASAYPTVAPSSVNVTPGATTLPAGDSHTLTGVVAPQDASNKDVVWTSSDPDVATVTGGRVLAKAAGTATITARTRLGAKTGTATVTVVPEPAHGELANHSFESGDLGGWTTTGDAFTASDVSTAGTWGWGGPFVFDGGHHLWSAGADGADPDARTGTLRTATVTLGGNGQVDFLVGGGSDPYRLRAELVRASDGAVLFRATGGDREAYTRVSWDASDHVGAEVYFRVTDTDTGGWGHLNVDDVNLPVAP
jgi:beta-fructofuranosidase